MKNFPFLLALLLHSHFSAAQIHKNPTHIAQFKRLEGNSFIFPEETIDSLMNPIKISGFFLGETHTRNFEALFKYHFITYLHKKYNVNNIFMEFGYSAAAIFNKFMSTGDTSLLKLDILYTSPIYMEMWKGLYAYNNTLVSGNKIHIYGVDFESPKTYYKSLLILRKSEGELPVNLKEIFDEIILWSTLDSKIINKSHSQNQKKIKTIFEKYNADIAKVYGENADIVYKIVKNNHFGMMDREREKYMSLNLHLELKNITGKFLCFFGGDHVNYNNPTALPLNLKSIPRFKDSIATIRMFSFDAIDNWSKEVVDCIGTYEAEECKKLRAVYINAENRAVLIGDKDISESFIKKSADFFIFAEDN